MSDSEADKAARKELFQKFDDDNSGYLSLAKIDKGIRDALGMEDLFEAKPVLIRAY